jgi:phosphopantothenoylcysteine decarboxylase/phosphopantothenate--cysteine ligase
VTSVVSTAFGSNIPIIIVPAMHESMYNHPIVIENIRKLKKLGVEFVGPRIEERKAKIAKTHEVADAVINRLAVEKDFSGLRILVTAGPTVEYIDPIRVVTNRSSGKMGVALAEEALGRGAEVTLVYGTGIAIPCAKANVIPVETTTQMYEAVVSELKSKEYDVAIAAAAAADWAPEKPFSHKVSTHKLDTLNLKLKPTRKIIDCIKKVSPKTFLVPFRAEYELSREELVESAHQRLLKAKADLIVVNDVSKKGAGFGSETNEVFIVDREKKVIHVPLAYKREVARKILNAVKVRIKPK